MKRKCEWQTGTLPSTRHILTLSGLLRATPSGRLSLRFRRYTMQNMKCSQARKVDPASCRMAQSCYPRSSCFSRSTTAGCGNERSGCGDARQGCSDMKQWDCSGSNGEMRNACGTRSNCATRNESRAQEDCRSDCGCTGFDGCECTQCQPTESDCLSGMVSLGMVYGPCQAFANLYDLHEGLANGTVFRDLNLPFRPGYGCVNPGARRGCGQ